MGQLSQALKLIEETGLTSTFTSEPFQVNGEMKQVMLAMNIKAATGVAGIEVEIQHSPGVSPGQPAPVWYTLETFATETGPTPVPRDIHLNSDRTHLFQTFRAVATITGGAPNVDLDVIAYYGS